MKKNERKNIPSTNKYFLSGERMLGCTKVGWRIQPWHSLKHSNEDTCCLYWFYWFYIWRYYGYGILHHGRIKSGSNDIVSTWSLVLCLNGPISIVVSGLFWWAPLPGCPMQLCSWMVVSLGVVQWATHVSISRSQIYLKKNRNEDPGGTTVWQLVL